MTWIAFGVLGWIAIVGWNFATKIRAMNGEIDDTADDWTEEHTR